MDREKESERGEKEREIEREERMKEIESCCHPRPRY